MSKSPKNHDPEKLLALFKKSKKVVATFTEKFEAQYGRRPRGEDLAKAPEYVRVCIKNCKKIKAQFEKFPETSPEAPKHEPKVVKPSSPKTNSTPAVIQKYPSVTGSENMDDLENLGYRNSPKKQAAPSKKSKVWGAHLNRSMSDITNNFTDRRNTAAKTTTYSGKLSALILEDLSKSTRKSLSQRRSNTKQMFFDTMEDESTLGTSQLINDAEISQVEDPLLRFHPELSMDGLSQHGQTNSDRFNIDDTECEVGQLGGTQTLKTQQPSKLVKETKSMSVLTSVTANHNVQATSRNFETREEIPMSFSGLFPKNGSGNGTKRKLEDENTDDLDSNDNEFSSKKQKICDEYVEEEEDMFADEHEPVENTKEDELLPLESVTNEDDEDSKNQENNKRKAKCPKKLQGLVSTNFVKIDLKHKNYIHGNKSKMTGAKYKRQEWKRKAQGKFGRNRK